MQFFLLTFTFVVEDNSVSTFFQEKRELPFFKLKKSLTELFYTVKSWSAKEKPNFALYFLVQALG